MTFLGHVVAVGGFGEVGQRRGRGCELHFATEATVAGGVGVPPRIIYHDNRMDTGYVYRLPVCETLSNLHDVTIAQEQ